MKVLHKILFAIVSVSFLPWASAADFEDTARVIRAVPHMQQVVQPRQECQTVMVPSVQSTRTPAGTIIGGLAGGLLGHQVGKGSGKTAATIAGAVGGALVGDHLANQHATVFAGEQAVRECRIVNVVESRPAGYEVTYTYRGKNFMTILPYEPGSTIPVRVNVHPA